MSRIEIRGFKSVARKTALVISDGVTCIAGPNGCGKSNIVDAVRWALGEQSPKALRASSMNDVIFSGTQDTPPSSLASVTLEFARDGGAFPKSLEGFDGFTVTRRLTRSGESEYFINNVRCRLKDITDLFVDTGLGKNSYAIVEQGKVKDIVQARPDEIRSLLEDAAEVGKFRVKRAEALRRLEGASRNLERVRDLLEEVSRQRQELKAQAAKARKYQELRAEANELERLVMTSEIMDVSRRRDTCVAALETIDARLKEAHERASALKGRMVSLEEEVVEARNRLERISGERAEARGAQGAASRELEALKARLKDVVAAREMLVNKVEESLVAMREHVARKDSLCTEIAELRSTVENLGGRLEMTRETSERLREACESTEAAYQEKRNALFALIAEYRSIEQREKESREGLAELDAVRAKRLMDSDALKEEGSALEGEIQRLESDKKALEDAMEPLEREIGELGSVRSAVRDRLERAAERIRDLDLQLARVSTKIDMLRRITGGDLDGSTNTTRDLNGSRKVGQSVWAKEGFENAVGKGLGTALDYVIVRDHDEILSLGDIAAKAPGFVIESPYVTEHAPGPPENGGRVLGRLEDFIETDREHEQIVRALAGDLLVVDGIDTAVSLWRKGYRECGYVTRDGMIMEPTGVVRTAPESSRYADVLRAKNEMNALEGLRGTLLREREEALGEHGDAKREAERLEECAVDAAGRKESLLGEIRSCTERLEALRARRRKNAEQVTLAEEDLERIGALREKTVRQCGELASLKAEQEKQRVELEGELRALDEQRRAAKDALARALEASKEAGDRLHAVQLELAQKEASLRALEEGIEEGRKARSKDEAMLEELSHASAALGRDIENVSRLIEETGARSAMLEERYAEALPVYEEAQNRLSSCRQEEKDLRGEIEELNRSREDVQLDLRQNEVTFSMAKERIEARFGPYEAVLPEGFDREEARKRAFEIEARIERMGQINFASLEEFEQVQKRWEGLHVQYEDLVQASSRLKEVIRNIERQSARAFQETFTQVKEYFREIFSSMFGGGRADLVETPALEGEEPGIEIIASPPFKKLRGMSLLSEGEKTLCAVSFLFALFKVNPAPFCILDEVDAPLDDANITRLNRLIRSFCEETQFIVVTHNRHTMETADILYGVTFETPGISKVVSMSLNGAQG